MRRALRTLGQVCHADFLLFGPERAFERDHRRFKFGAAPGIQALRSERSGPGPAPVLQESRASAFRPCPAWVFLAAFRWKWTCRCPREPARSLTCFCPCPGRPHFGRQFCRHGSFVQRRLADAGPFGHFIHGSLVRAMGGRRGPGPLDCARARPETFHEAGHRACVQPALSGRLQAFRVQEPGNLGVVAALPSGRWRAQSSA